MRLYMVISMFFVSLEAQEIKVAILDFSRSAGVKPRASKALLSALKKEIRLIGNYIIKNPNDVIKSMNDSGLSLNDCSKECYKQIKLVADIDILIKGQIKRSGDNFSLMADVINTNKNSVEKFDIISHGGMTRLINQASDNIKKYLIGHKAEVMTVLADKSKDISSKLNRVAKEIICNDGEVALWNSCYSIIGTDTLILDGKKLEKKLSGGIPSVIGDLINLKHIDLSWNDLEGIIPEELKNLVKLETLLIRGNRLTGEFLYIFEKLPKLEMPTFLGMNGLIAYQYL